MLLARDAVCPKCYRYFRFEYDWWYSAVYPLRAAIAPVRPPYAAYVGNQRQIKCLRCLPRLPHGRTEWHEYIPGQEGV